MKQNIAALTVCFSQLLSGASYAQDVPESRAASPEERQQCESSTDFHVITIDNTASQPAFEVLGCGLQRVSTYSCADLFKLASISSNVRRIQGGTLNEAQTLLENKWYVQVGDIYATHCNLSS